MSSLTSAQRNAVSQFAAATGASTRSATTYLRNNAWNVERAVDEYYDSGAAATPKKESKAVVELFEKYKDPEDPSTIGIDGTINYIQDLGVALEDPVVLALACKLEGPTMGQFTKQGFIKGWQSMNADTIPKMKKAVESLSTDLANDPAFFKQVYRFTFGFVRPQGQRVLPLDTAVEYWKLLLEDKFPSEDLFCKWITFVTAEHKKAVPKDTWNMLLDFVVNVLGPDNGLDSYDAEGAWPSIFDEFVAYLRR
ncbi:Cullin binding-domain-containing protein [Lipomyces orientalis]|uniref:Cullin binding-domain-containing protein n=1 Tax=Lipomyces orientalis TaxID=1233043 RepID=A0ACC3TCH1_9ASCO